MNCSRTSPVLDGAEEIGVVIRSSIGFEAIHEVLGNSANNQSKEDARLTRFDRDQRVDVA
ncbi:hypothetical protein IWQ51_006621 [Labrenzia sp. EL_142]|nr:hypothetical protein [Labrenzia sp. EL_142]